MKTGNLETEIAGQATQGPSTEPTDVYYMPASRAQQLIWSRAAHAPNAAAWNVAVRFTLHGELRTAAFRNAVARVVAANEILRTSFIEQDSTLLQVIHPSMAVPVSVVDLSLLSAPEQKKYLDERSRAEASRPFDLNVPPLLRIRLVGLAHAENVLLVTVHHAISDGWSIGLISDALMQAYADELAATPPTDNSDLQYADYCVWQTEHHESVEYQRHATFWTNYLADVNASTSPAPPESDPESAISEAVIKSVVLPTALTDRISALARYRGVTFSQVVASAFAILKSLQTRQQTIVFGAPVPGRDSTELESIIGPFVNYLPVRVECAPTTKISVLLKSTSEMFAEWIAHSEYRYADILKALNRDSDPFDALFISQRDFVRTVERGGLMLSALPSVSPGALYGLTFFLVERKDGWRASCEIDTTKYTIEEAQAMLVRYQRILEAFAENSERTISQLTAQLDQGAQPIFSAPASAPREHAATFVDFPASEAQARYYLLDHSDPGKGTFHLRIRLKVDGELQVNRVTEAFDILVRRHEVLRTTFVMVDDQLCQRVHEPTLPPSFEHLDVSTLIAADRDEAIRLALQREDGWQFDNATGPLLRVFVTDVGQHQWILSITMAHLLADGWSAGILQNEFQKIYAGLIHGHQVDLADLSLQYGDYAIGEEQWLQSTAVKDRVKFWRNQLSGKMTALDLPVDCDAENSTKANGSIEFATLDASLASSVKVLARDLETTPFVIYGAIFQALLFRYSNQTDITFSTPLASRTEETENVIGPFSTPVLLRSRLKPDWSMRQYVLALHHVAMEAFDNSLPFEKYADSLALGTVRGRHSLNQLCFFYQKAFVEKSETDGIKFSPFATAITGASFEWQLAMIERTGGEVTAELQYDADRYSSASIQTALCHYERLLSEALFYLDTPVRDIAFVTSEETTAGAEHPEQLLPISKRALGIDLPLNVQQIAENAAQVPDVAPRNDQESAMANLWQQAFRRDRISIHSNFFDLGGHSLILARLQALCHKELGKRIYAADLFAAPTIALLTARLNGTDTTSAAFNRRLIPLRAEGTQPPLFLISQSMVFRRMAECLGSDQPVFTVQIEDEDLKGTETFEQFASLYVNTIREIRPHGPYRIGGWCAAGHVAYEIAQQLRASGETVEMLVIVDAWAPGYWRDLRIGRKIIAKTNYYWARFQLHRRALAALASQERTAFFKERTRVWKASIARQMGSISFLRRQPTQVGAEDQTTLADQVQYAASLKYQARPWPGTALLFRSAEQPIGKFLPHDMGWAQVLTEKANITNLPGDHRKIFEDPGAQIIAASVQAFLSGNATGIQVSSHIQPQVTHDDLVGKRSCALIGL